MHLSTSFWKAVTVVSSYLSFSPLHSTELQQPLPLPIDAHANSGLESSKIHANNDFEILGAPIFAPPGLGDDTDPFKCRYPEMKGWQGCSTPYDRSCWLRHPDGRRYDILTDYENDMPTGVIREYNLTVTNGDFNTDGLLSKDMILVNGQYPGPLIQACWGDQVIVHVTNKLQFNGTAVHWHGIRQNQSMPMDGVPGITQCPIAPNDTFTYKFNATQYGTSWYHSHYSVQYANGLLGPMTLHGPTSVNWDEPKEPLLVTDWFHNSSFAVIHDTVKGYPSILINGKGNITKYDGTNNETYPKPNNETFGQHEIHFEKQVIYPSPKPVKRYLLRIINTSFSTTFTFSIDNHLLSIVSADFVPVLPYPRSHITVGIGQRYTVIVEANPVDYGQGLPKDGNYWMRTTVAKCYLLSVIAPNEYNTTGILRYDNTSRTNPTTKPWHDLTNTCDDVTGLTPQLPWTIGPPKNGNHTPYGQEFEATLDLETKIPTFPLAKWSLEPEHDPSVKSFVPLQIDYSDPIFLRLNENRDKKDWPAKWVVVPEDYKNDDWIYLAFAGPEKGSQDLARHPMHLHGHDFAIVQISDKPLLPENIVINKNNPMRRDVILLPRQGFIIIAFKADNPGSWIMHCHIAFHASEGLALQVLERQSDANKLWLGPSNPEIVEAQRVCKEWKKFEDDCSQHWPGYNSTLQCWPACANNCTKPQDPHVFMDDSGI